MIPHRFLRARLCAAPISALSLLGAALTPGAAWAQTAPELGAPTAGVSAGSIGGTLLLNNAFDFAPEGAEAPQPSAQTPPSTASVVADEAASGAKALGWKYSVGRDEPRLSWSLAQPLDLSGAKSIGLKVKSDVGAAIEIWFETQPQGEGAEALGARYSTTVWSAGGAWQEVSIDRARFVGHEVKGGTVSKAPIPSAMWDTGWSHIARWGVSDASNFWRLFAGQTRSNGPRTIWLDDLKISTAPSPNPALPVLEAPKPKPKPKVQDEEPEDDEDGPGFDPRFGPNGNPNGFNANPNGFDGNPNFNPNNDPRFGPGNGPQFFPQVLEGGQAGGRGGVRNVAADDFGNQGAPNPDFQDFQQPGQPDEGEDEAAPAEVQVQAVVQDAWGAQESWIPINGTTAALPGARAGLKWSVVRLANRDAMLISTVNPELLRGFPPESTRRKPRGANVVIGGPERLLRLAIAVKSAKPTILQVALYESDGGVWIAPVPIDKVILGAVPVVNLADMKNAPTKRDANGQLDLDKVVAISLNDLGAQKSLSGPNDITLRGLTWIY